MQIDFNQDFQPLTGKEGPLPNFKDIAINALVLSLKDDDKISGDKKFKLGMLAQKIAESDGPLEISIEDAARLKERIGQAYGPYVVYQAWKILEGDKNEE